LINFFELLEELIVHRFEFCAEIDCCCQILITTTAERIYVYYLLLVVLPLNASSSKRRRTRAFHEFVEEVW